MAVKIIKRKVRKMKRLFKGFILAMAALMAAFCLFAACDGGKSGDGSGDEGGTQQAAVTKISITGAPADLQIDVDEEVTLGYTLTPAGAEGTVVWSSTDESKATVSTSGKVKGIAAGSVIIKAAAEGTQISDSVALTVVAPVVANPVTEISVSAEGLSEGALSMKRGETISLSVADTPENCDAYTLSWTTDTTGVVEVVRTVDGYDLVAEGYGTAEVVATVEGTQISDSFTVTVEGDIDDNGGVMTETFSRGEIDREGVYYLDAEKLSTSEAPIYHGAFFDAGTRVTSAAPSYEMTNENGKLNWTVTSPANYERITFRYNGTIDTDELYIVRIPITLESVTDPENGLNYRFVYGYREVASETDAGYTYNSPATSAPEHNYRTYGEGSTIFFGFTEVGETKYLDIRVSSAWNGEVYVCSNATNSAGAKGKMTCSFDNLQVISTSRYVYEGNVEAFEDAEAANKVVTSNMLKAEATGDMLSVSYAVNSDTDKEGNQVSGLVEKIESEECGPDSEYAPSMGKFLLWTTGRIYAESVTPSEVHSGDVHQKLILTFDSSVYDPAKAYTIDIPVQVRMTAQSETFDVADLKIKVYDSQDTSNLLTEAAAGTFAVDGANTVIRVTIEAGSDWEGILCLRVYNDDITTDVSTKLRFFIDNIVISEAVSA